MTIDKSWYGCLTCISTSWNKEIVETNGKCLHVHYFTFGLWKPRWKNMSCWQQVSVVKNFCNSMLTKTFQLVNKDFLGHAVKCLAKIKVVFSPQFSPRLSSRLLHHRRLSSNIAFLSRLLDLNLLGNTFQEGSIHSFSWEKRGLGWCVVSQIILW